MAIGVGLGAGALLAVQCLGQDPGERGLPGPSRPREQVGLADLSRVDRVLERPDDRLLSDDVVESLRAILPVEGGHRSDAIARGSGWVSGLSRTLAAAFL